jgi:hypothetical protein
VEVAERAHEGAGDRPQRLAQRARDDLGHRSISGRTSTPPPPGHARAIASASSSSGTSTTQKPPTTSLPSRNGPSVTSGVAAVEVDRGGGLGRLELAARAQPLAVDVEPAAHLAQPGREGVLVQRVVGALAVQGAAEQEQLLHGNLLSDAYHPGDERGAPGIDSRASVKNTHAAANWLYCGLHPRRAGGPCP